MTTNTFAAQANTDPQAPTAAQEGAAPTQAQGTDQQPALVVGERAFASLEDVKTKIVNADTHISTIEAENAQLRAAKEALEEELRAAKSLDDALKAKDNARESSGLTEDQIRNIAKETLSATQQEEQRNANRTGCLSAAEEAYGKDFIKNIAEEASKLDMQMTDVDKMAESNPALFRKLFIPKGAPKAVPSSFNSDVNTTGFQENPAPAEEKTVLNMTSRERARALERKLQQLQS